MISMFFTALANDIKAIKTRPPLVFRELARYPDCFISHDWDVDPALTDRVLRIRDALTEKGLDVWCDDGKSSTSTRDIRLAAIAQSKCFLVILTESYRDKVNGSDKRHACHMEFQHATLQLGGQRMVAVRIDRTMGNPRDWKGKLGAELGSNLYRNCSKDDAAEFDQSITDLHAEIMKINSAVDAPDLGEQPYTDCFLSHNWGPWPGNENHLAVQRVYEALKKRGLKVWFDEVLMRGDVRQVIAQAIERTKCFVVFVTDTYRTKINGPDSRDNCQYEFRYAAQIFGAQKMVVAVMEPGLSDPRGWRGRLGAELASKDTQEIVSLYSLPPVAGAAEVDEAAGVGTVLDATAVEAKKEEEAKNEEEDGIAFEQHMDKLYTEIKKVMDADI